MTIYKVQHSPAHLQVLGQSVDTQDKYKEDINKKSTLQKTLRADQKEHSSVRNPQISFTGLLKTLKENKRVVMSYPNNKTKSELVNTLKRNQDTKHGLPKLHNPNLQTSLVSTEKTDEKIDPFKKPTQPQTTSNALKSPNPKTEHLHLSLKYSTHNTPERSPANYGASSIPEGAHQKKMMLVKAPIKKIIVMSLS